MNAADLADFVKDGAYRIGHEAGLQRGIERRLAAAGLLVEPERRLNESDRIDFVVDRVGIEVKVTGTADALARQVLRYAQSPLLDEILVVTTSWRHHDIPREMNGKPVHVLQIGGIL